MQVGDEGLDDPLVAGEPAQQAGAGQQQERGHEQGGRGTAGPRLALAGDFGRLGYPGAEVAGGGHGDRHDPDLVAELAAGGRPSRGHRDRYGDLAELLAARGQQGSQRPGDRGEQHVVDGAAVRVSQVAEASQVDGDDIEPPPRPDRPVQRCRLPLARWPGASQFRHPFAHPAQAPRLARGAGFGPRRPAQAASPGIGGEFPCSRCRAGTGPLAPVPSRRPGRPACRAPPARRCRPPAHGVGWAAQRGPVFIVDEPGPFPGSLPPNSACTFQRTELSSDLCRVRDGVRVDLVVAGGADDERLAPHFRHEGGPRGLARSRLPEFLEAGDLVDCHRGAGLAELAFPFAEPSDQLLAGIGCRGGRGVADDRPPVSAAG